MQILYSIYKNTQYLSSREASDRNICATLYQQRQWVMHKSRFWARWITQLPLIYQMRWNAFESINFDTLRPFWIYCPPVSGF